VAVGCREAVGARGYSGVMRRNSDGVGAFQVQGKERERGGEARGFIGGEILGEGLGFGGGALHRTGGVASVPERDSVAR
jgi:hypothetical protein